MARAARKLRMRLADGADDPALASGAVAALERLHARALRTIHLVVLLVATLLVWWNHPASGLAILPGLLAALAGEILVPRSWRRRFAGEILVVLGAALGLAIASQGATGAMAGWLRVSLVAWALVPVRSGGLALLAVMIGIEALGRDLRGPGGGVTDLLLPGLVLLLLLLDAWSAGLRPPRSPIGLDRLPALRMGWWSVALLVLVALAAQGLTAGLGGLLRRDQHRASAQNAPAAVDLETGFDPGYSDDWTPYARLLLPADHSHQLTWQYLRLRSMGDVALLPDGNLRWTAGAVGGPIAEVPRAGPAAVIELLAWQGRGVLLPDGARWVEAPVLQQDAEGNRRFPGTPLRRYRTDLPRERLVPGPGERRSLEDFRRVPPEFARVLRPRISELERWRVLPTASAAPEIVAWIQARSGYRRQPPAMDPALGRLGSFLFGNTTQRFGNCQHFAGATVLLLRLAGHPARLVGGLTSRAWDERGLLFRARNAHAWCEWWDGAGWVRLEATPPDGVGGDDGTAEPEQTPAATAAAATAPVTRTTAANGVRDGGLLLAIVLAGGGVAAAWWWSRRRAGPADARNAVLRRRSDELLALAARHGLHIEPGTTLAQACAHLERRSGVSLATCLAAHQAARYHHGPLPPPWPVAQLAEALQERASRGR